MGANQEERLCTSPAKFASTVRDPSHTITSDKSRPIERDRSQQYVFSVLKNSVKILTMAVAIGRAAACARPAKNKKALFAPANKASLLDQASLIAECPDPGR